MEKNVLRSIQVIVHLLPYVFHSEPSNVVKYKFFFMDLQSHGSVKKFNLVVLLATLGNCVNMQTSVVITETSIFFNILATIHYIISKMVSICNIMFSWSNKCCLMKMHICVYMQIIRTAIIEKTSFLQYLENYA